MRKEKRKMMFTLLILLFLGLGIGYAALATNLSINGTSTMIASSWDIHFENLNVVDGSVDIGTGDSAASITSPTTITYTVTLAQPGDFYDFTVDVKNDGTIDGMIGNVSYKVNGSSTEHLYPPFEYYIMYTDGTELDANQQLLAGEKETLKVHIGYSTNINASDLPSTDTTKTITVEITYVQADENAFSPHPDFATDPWDQIVNHPNGYPVGSTREITIPSLGTYHLRIINNSIPPECDDNEFSESACGLVIEFVEAVSPDRKMNENSSNSGGWPNTSLRTYLNTTFFSMLPSDLRELIIETKVISSNNCISNNPCTAFESTDLIYLISACEFSNCGSIFAERQQTRIMDYYLQNPGNKRKKRINGNYANYWYRTGYSNYQSFYIVDSEDSGSSFGAYADETHSYVPIFRIALSE